ncbi:hypothetical protein LTR36_001260 [Oleoguttula mirabilis]|uniref:ER transporter 6TM N-terminal domain-containing protein n=1 Tax=Oleoguttula mirabilis TaxID=1507867 RepID=A0AAV9JNT6_9PEZI|nr:hypothetical protein LTR36_001260 [Oleoguttula mirabilis]
MSARMDGQQSRQSGSSGDDGLKTTEETKQDAEQKIKKPTAQPLQPEQRPSVQKQPSKLKQLWDRAGLDVMTLSLMLKGSLAPTIAIAMFQSDAVAARFSTLGYLVAIMSILGFAVMPRGKFIQTMSLNILSTGLAASINLLALYCVTQARLHTTAPGHPLQGYNSSASAVCAVWLVVQIYFVNCLRAARPQFQFPAIIYSIFVLVSLTYGTQFPTMAYAISFMERLLEAFLTGFGLATGVHFLVFPTSSRMVVFKEMTGYLMCLNGMLKAQTAYMSSLESLDPVKLREEQEEEASKTQKKNGKKGAAPLGPLTTPAGLKLKEVLGKTMELHAKLSGDIVPAKREFAFGKLESHDLTELWRLLRLVFIPVMGLSASIDLIQRRAIEDDWAHEAETEHAKRKRHEQLDNVHFLMKQLHEPFALMAGDIEAAVTHVLITLELFKAQKRKGDEESKGDLPVPGSTGFAELYRKKVDGFYQSKEKTLKDWCKEHGIELPDDFFESTFVKPEQMLIHEEHVRERYQRQLFFTLYLEYLLWRAGAAVLDVVLYADRRKQEGALKRSKLIFPGSMTLYKWLKSSFAQEDLSNDSHLMGDLDAGGAESVFLGAEFSRKMDPEHQPPRNTVERMGERIRLIPKFFRSDASAFGVRVVCATMTVAIICYLEASQTFFLEQRLLWACIMVAISMTRTAGQSTWGFALRIIGTLIAMLGAYAIWYIVDGKTSGVIVFLWLWMTCAFYFILKFPKMVIVALLSLVTAVLIIGYELQVQKIGVTASESNGQPAYPTYELAPYRLACVVGGLFVAFIWTIFPFPVSESSELRKDLGASLYLLSNFYSIVHETIRSRVQGTDANAKVKGTHAYHLDKARNAVFSKLILLLTNLKTNAAFSKLQLRVGGRFPREEYEGLIEVCQRVLQYMALMAYASTTFSIHTRDGEVSQWSKDFRKLLTSVNTTSHQVTSLLSLLSSSMTNGQPLPPYLEMPKPFQFLKKLESIDPDLLSIRHIAEPEYSAFAVVSICAQAVHNDVEKLTNHVKALVGELDFTFHSVKSNQESTDASSMVSDDDRGKLD